jgi:hypothetical protein
MLVERVDDPQRSLVAHTEEFPIDAVDQTDVVAFQIGDGNPGGIIVDGLDVDFGARQVRRGQEIADQYTFEFGIRWFQRVAVRRRTWGRR